MVSGTEFCVEILKAITMFSAIYYFFKNMNTKNIGVMNWDSIIRFLIHHLKSGKRVGIRINGDNLSFTIENNSFCGIKETFVVEIVDTYNMYYRNLSLPSMLLSFLQKQKQRQIGGKIIYYFDDSLELAMDNRKVYNVVACDIVDGVYTTYNTTEWTWPNPDGSGFHKIADIEGASDYLFTGKKSPFYTPPIEPLN